MRLINIDEAKTINANFIYKQQKQRIAILTYEEASKFYDFQFGKTKLRKLKKVIKEEMQECMRLEALAKQNVKFENARLQAKAWAELEWVLGEIDKLEKGQNGM